MRYLILLVALAVVSSPVIAQNPTNLGQIPGNILYADALGFTASSVDAVGKIELIRLDGEARELERISLKQDLPIVPRSDRAILSTSQYVVVVVSERVESAAGALKDRVSVFERNGTLRFTGTLSPHSRIGDLEALSSVASEGENVYLRRISARSEDGEVLEKIDLATQSLTIHSRFATPSNGFAAANGIVTVLRQFSGTDGQSRLSLLNYSSSGTLLKAVPAAQIFGNPNANVPRDTYAVLTENDATNLDVINVLVSWDFLSKRITFDRASLTKKSISDFEPRLLGYKLNETWFVLKGKTIGSSRSPFQPGLGAHTWVDNQRWAQSPARERAVVGDIVYSSDYACADYVARAQVCNRLDALPTAYRIKLAERPLGAMQLQTSNGLKTAQLEPSFQGNVKFAQPLIIHTHVKGSELVIPVTTNGLDGNVSVKSGDGRWQYDAVKRVLTASAQQPGIIENVTLLVSDMRGLVGSIQLTIEYLEGDPDRLIEYFNDDLDHYFITLWSDESRAVDSGAAGVNWKRTGRIFPVWSGRSSQSPSDPAVVKGVCRFYGDPAIGTNGKRTGPNSHFYTADDGECASVRAGGGWRFESGDAFRVRLSNGSCDAFGLSVRRFYNDGFPNKDANHRFVVDPASSEAMRSLGWIDEGVVFCARYGAGIQ
jgi:hypothetical protein